MASEALRSNSNPRYGKNNTSVLDRLYKFLIVDSEYNPVVLPAANNYTPVNVSFGLELVLLKDVNEAGQRLEAYYWIRQNWLDHFLQWDPADFEGQTSINLPADDVWLPSDIVLGNSVQKPTDRTTHRLIVNHTGAVQYLTYGIYQSSCNLDMRYFPFDKQQCDLIFWSWSHSTRFIDIHPAVSPPPNGTGNFQKSEEWELVSFRVKRTEETYLCCEYPFAIITYHLQLNRKPLYYLYNIILPSGVIIAIAIVGFFTPSTAHGERKEKVSLGIITCLSVTMLLVMISESLPPTSRVVPLLIVYFGALLLLSILATLTTVIIMKFESRAHDDIPFPAVLKRILPTLSKLTLVNTGNLQEMQPPQRNPRPRLDDAVTSIPFLDVDSFSERKGKTNGITATERELRVLLTACRLIEDLLKAQTANSKKNVSLFVQHWYILAKVLDRFLLVFFLLFLVGMTLVLFLPQLY